MTDRFAYAEARRARDIGMQRAADNAGPTFGDAAYAAIERVARRQVHVHIDDVLAQGIPPPHHPNAWGPVWLRAIRAGIIQRSNQVRPCKSDRKKHAHQYPIYFSRLYGSE